MSIIRPLKLLFLSPIVLALSTFMAVVYGYLYLLFTTITEVFEDTYHFSSGAVGLTYLGIGLGSILGLAIFGVASDRIVKAKSAAGEMKPEYRLPPMIPGAYAIPIGCGSCSAITCWEKLTNIVFIYGWTAEKHVFWIVPIIGTGLVGLGLLATFVYNPSLPPHYFCINLHLDANFYVPCRRLHSTRRLCPRSQHRPALPGRCSSPIGRPQDVRDPRSWMGKLFACVHRT